MCTAPPFVPYKEIHNEARQNEDSDHPAWSLKTGLVSVRTNGVLQICWGVQGLPLEWGDERTYKTQKEETDTTNFAITVLYL